MRLTEDSASGQRCLTSCGSQRERGTHRHTHPPTHPSGCRTNELILQPSSLPTTNHAARQPHPPPHSLTHTATHPTITASLSNRNQTTSSPDPTEAPTHSPDSNHQHQPSRNPARQTAAAHRAIVRVDRATDEAADHRGPEIASPLLSRDSIGQTVRQSSPDTALLDPRSLQAAAVT